ncbi:MAG: dockerin type I domain-containing protein [Clostridiales bacterium]|jgi:hypothetical protein|nr:dockerin type I domain-containing protein [Clostridiales bacterium]
MRQTRKLIACFASAVLAVSAVAVFKTAKVYATTAPTVKVASQEIEKGTGSVSVDILLSNNPGIWGATLKVQFDESKLQLKPYPESLTGSGEYGYTTGDVELPMTAKSVHPSSTESLSKNTVKFIFEGNINSQSQNNNNNFDNGKLITLNFNVIDPSYTGNINISIVEFSAFQINEDTENKDPKKITSQFEIEDDIITVKEPPIAYGDFNNDTIVDDADVLAIRRFITSKNDVSKMKVLYPTETAGINFNETAADFDNSGEVDGNDVLWLKRYISCNNSVSAMLEKYDDRPNDFAHLNVN